MRGHPCEVSSGGDGVAALWLRRFPTGDAYGVGARLAYLSGDTDVLQDEDLERFMLETRVAAGKADGATGMTGMWTL
jgi:hypothetical protein